MAASLALAALSLPLVCSVLCRASDRARLRRGAPGLIVHVAILSVALVRLAGWAAQAAIEAVFEGKPGVYPTRWTVEVLDYFRDDLRRDATVAILASWLVLLLVKKWNPERAWDDRLGRFLALVWVAFYLCPQILLLWP